MLSREAELDCMASLSSESRYFTRAQGVPSRFPGTKKPFRPAQERLSAMKEKISE
jgi:hypothetical protein